MATAQHAGPKIAAPTRSGSDRTSIGSIRAMLQYVLDDAREQNFTELCERLEFAIQAADKLSAGDSAADTPLDHGQNRRNRRR